MRVENYERHKRVKKNLHLINEKLMPEVLAGKCRVLQQEHRIKIVFNDSLKLTQASESETIKHIKLLKNMAKEINLPVFITLEVPGQTGENPFTFPNAGFLKITAMADIVLLIRKMEILKPASINESPTCEIAVIKSPTGENGTEKLFFFPHSGLFNDWVPPKK